MECQRKCMTSDLVLKAIGRYDYLVTYEEAEPFTTRAKTMDFSKAGDKKT